MVVLKRIGVLSSAKVNGLIGLLLGLIIGVLVALFGAAAAFLGMPFGAALGILAIIIFPIYLGILGFVFGAILALLYNLAAGWVGGLKLEIEVKKKKR